MFGEDVPAPKMVAALPIKKPFLRVDNPILWVAGIGGLLLYYAIKNRRHMAAKRNMIANPSAPLALPAARNYNPRQRFTGFCGMGETRNPVGERGIFTLGNAKLGKKIWAFSLPAETTCPGASEWCLKHCYMKPLEKLRKFILPMYEHNYKLSMRPDFAQRAIAELQYKGMMHPEARIVRVHVDGDFYDNDYISKWIKIAKAFPDWKFYAYTKSWRVPNLLPALNKLRALPKFSLRASTDDTTETPPLGWKEAGIGKCKSTDSPKGCEFYNTLVQCDKCRVCIGKTYSIALKAH